MQLATEKTMNLQTVRHFVLDECDKMLENLGESSQLFTINLFKLLAMHHQNAACKAAILVVA